MLKKKGQPKPPFHRPLRLIGMSSANSNIAFKHYSNNQIMLLPPSLEELIIENHPVRLINQVIDQIDIDSLLKNYKGGGTSSFHPRMMLKVLVYAYINNVYSSRKIESAVKENIHFMWLAGMNKPDHNTINRFRSERLKDVLKQLFAQVVLMLNQEGFLDIKDIYTDGTKIEANANKYTFVWGKAIQTSKDRISKQLQEIWDYTQEVAKEEILDKEPISFDQIDSQKVAKTIDQINELLKDKPVDKKVKQKLNYAKRNWPAKLDQYEQAEQVLNNERNSFSKTDNDATFMRMKEDHMQNGQLKPGYNVQVSSSNQYIVNYTLHPNPTDTKTLPSHINAHQELYKQLPSSLTADAGYGSEENYVMLENNNIEAFVKYNMFDKQQKTVKVDKYPFSKDKLYYNTEHDYYICPMGQKMEFIGKRNQKTETEFTQQLSTYQAINCVGCPLRSQCHKAKGNRRIEVNHNLDRLKNKARTLLTSELGIIKRKKRVVDTEPVFANIKQNKGFRRFMLRGKNKVEIEWGLIAIAHNLKKRAVA
jgi:transposase